MNELMKQVNESLINGYSIDDLSEQGKNDMKLACFDAETSETNLVNVIDEISMENPLIKDFVEKIGEEIIEKFKAYTLSSLCDIVYSIADREAEE